MRLDYNRLQDSVGESTGPSRWICIDQDRIDQFAEVTEDRQWIHVNPVRAGLAGFGGTIAHGFLTLSLAAGVLEELVVVQGAGMTINYGLNRVRFPATVPAGSRVRGELTLTAAIPHSGGTQVSFSLTFHSEANAVPVCVAELLICYFPILPDLKGGTRSGQSN